MLRLLAENSQCEKIKNAILEFAEDPRIDSCGIRSLKRQLEDYIIIIDAVKHANMTDIEEYVVANTIIGSEDLDGSAVTRREQEIELKKISDANASWYRWEYHHARLDPLNDGSYYYDMMKMYEAESEEHQKEIDECTRIILKYDAIEYSTKLLLAHGTQHREYIADALEAMGKAFDGSDYNPYVSEYWRNTLAHKNPQKSYNCLKAEGVTDEQIANMKEKGYSLEEILELVKFCNLTTNDHAETDRAFLDAMMNRDYTNAFLVFSDPSDLSDEMYEFLTDYAMRLQPYDEDYYFIGNEDELEELVNAIWEADNSRQATVEALNMKMPNLVDVDPVFSNSISLSRQCLCRISNISQRRAIEDAFILAFMDSTDDGFYDQRLNFFNSRAAMDFWGTQYSLSDMATAGNTLNQISIYGLDMKREDNNGQASFYISCHYNNGGFDTIDLVEIQSARDGSHIALTDSYIAMKKAQEDYENQIGYDGIDNIKNKQLTNLFLEGAVEAHPELTSLFTIYKITSDYIDEYIEDTDATKAAKKNMQDKNDSFFYQWYAGATVYTMTRISTDIDYSDIDISELSGPKGVKLTNDWLKTLKKDNAISLEEYVWYKQHSWFKPDNGPSTHLISCSLVNPGAMRTMNDWLTNGINTSFVNFGEDSDGNTYEPDVIYERILNECSISDEEEELCYYLLLGADDTHPIENIQQKFEDGTIDMDLVYSCLDKIAKKGNTDIANLYADFKKQSESYGYFPGNVDTSGN